MGHVQTLRLKYVGTAALASGVAQTLREEGVELQWSPPEERRGIQEMVEAVTVYYVCKGTDQAINAAVKKIREWMGSRGNVDIDEEQEGSGSGAVE